MKQKLMVLARIVVSVGILAYLFNSIFQDEAAKYFAAQQIDPAELSWAERTYTTWTQGPNSLWEVFQQLSPAWFALGVACSGLVCLFGIIRWRLVLRVQGLDLTFPRVSSIWFIGMFFNAFMLGSTGGDVIKAWYVAHETHHKKAEAVITVIVDRFIGLMALFGLALTVMGVFHERVFDDPKLRGFALFTGATLLGAVVAGGLSLWPGLADKAPRLQASFQRLPKYDMIKRLIDAFRIYARTGVLVKTCLLSVGVHLSVILSVACVGRGLSIATDNGILDYFLYLPIINSIAAVPISISGLGVREGLYGVMFGQVGVSTSLAVAMSLFGYFALMFWSVFGSVFFLTHRKELPPAKDIVDGTAEA